MATANDILKRAMRLVGALGDGESPTASEGVDGLNALNSMLEAWSIDRLAVYHILQESFTWTGGQSSRTIGSGGNFSTTRPTRIEDGFTRISSVDYPYKVCERPVYDTISDKTTQASYPEYLFYDATYPLGTLYVWPVPSASVSVYVNSWKQLQSFSALTTALSLPPGYQRAIEFNLAVEFSPELQVKVPDWVAAIARTSKAALKSVNAQTIVAGIEPMLEAQSTFNINRG